MTWMIALPSETQLPWILHHWTILCPKETMNPLVNTLRTLTLTPLAELLKQFWQLKDQFASLKSPTHPPTLMAELMQHTNKLQHLTMMLQPQTAPSLMWKQYTKLCRHIQTPCMQHREKQTSPCPW